MVLLKIALVGFFFIAMLGVAKNQHWLERGGLVASCQNIGTPYGQAPGRVWYLCREGIITGFPTLEADACVSMGLVAGKRELWHCPTLSASAPLV